MDAQQRRSTPIVEDGGDMARNPVLLEKLLEKSPTPARNFYDISSLVTANLCRNVFA
jgi:hypothetical protein